MLVFNVMENKILILRKPKITCRMFLSAQLFDTALRGLDGS